MKKITLILFALFIMKDISAQKSWSQNTRGIPSSVSINEFTKVGDNLYAAGTFMDTKTFTSEIRLYKSSDNGVNWIQVETNGLKLLSGNAIFNSKGKLLVSGTIVQSPMEFSIHSSEDNGLTWSQNTRGITSSVSINEFTKVGDDLYAAGTFMDTKTFTSEIRFYKSSDNGVNWKQVETNDLKLLTGNTIFNSKGKLLMSGTIVQSPMEFSIYCR